MNEASKLLHQAAQATKLEAFTNPAEASDEDALGIALAKWSEWNGDAIAEVFFAALEDANFHQDRADFILLWNHRHGTAFN